MIILINSDAPEEGFVVDGANYLANGEYSVSPNVGHKLIRLGYAIEKSETVKAKKKSTKGDK